MSGGVWASCLTQVLFARGSERVNTPPQSEVISNAFKQGALLDECAARRLLVSSFPLHAQRATRSMHDTGILSVIRMVAAVQLNNVGLKGENIVRARR